MSYLFGILIITGIIAAHELGHALCALYSGVKIDKFSIGFPLPYITITYRLPRNKYLGQIAFSPLLFGGFVSVDEEKIKALSLPRQILFFLGGIMGNLAVASITLIAMGQPVLASLIKPVVITIIGPFLVASELIKGGGGAELMGPVGIVKQLALGEHMGILVVMISMSLAIINVMPIPPLDGGRIFFAVLGKIFSKKRVDTIEHWLSICIIYTLLAAMLYVTYFDIKHKAKPLPIPVKTAPGSNK